MKRKILILLLLICAGSTLSGQNQQTILDSQTELYRGISYLYAEQGMAPPSNSAPWSIAELSTMLNNVQLHSLTKEGKALYNIIKEKLFAQPRFQYKDLVGLESSIAYNLEFYLHQNNTQFMKEQDWNYRWTDRQPIISIPFGTTADKAFYAYIELTIMQRLLDSASDPAGIYQNIIHSNNYLTDFFQLDLNWPYRAFVSAGGERWNIQFGRERINWGHGHTGNLLVSDHQPFHDVLLFSTWLDKITYTTGMINFTPPDWGNGSGPGATEDTGDDFKALIAHRLEFHLLPSLNAALTESMMYQSDSLDLKFLNPSMIYHQYFMRDISNSLLTFELEWAPFNRLITYVQFGIDELQILGESTSVIPNALGYITGLEYTMPLQDGYLNIWGEFVSIDPMFYLRDGVNFVTPIRQQYPRGGMTMIDYYLGYPWGGDVRTIASGAVWENLRNLKVEADVVYVSKGETTPTTAYPPTNPTAVTPSGIPENRLIITGGGEYVILRDTLKVFQLTLNAELSWYHIVNYDHILGDNRNDIQFIAGITCKL
jgi:hypothetical protein